MNKLLPPQLSFKEIINSLVDLYYYNISNQSYDYYRCFEWTNVLKKMTSNYN